jgi:3-isopropylmalate/(R)-2-methylmalate dehydratase small subunit
VHQWLVDNPGAEVSIDLETSTLTLPDGQSIGFPIDSFARYCLLNGIDQLGFLMQHSQTILDFEQRAS